jgi:hypothetical protein
MIEIAKEIMRPHIHHEPGGARFLAAWFGYHLCLPSCGPAVISPIPPPHVA